MGRALPAKGQAGLGNAAAQLAEQDRHLDVLDVSLMRQPPAFPINEPLFGLSPDSDNASGGHLGAKATCDERGILITALDPRARMASNPFSTYQVGRIDQGMAPAAR